MPQGVAARRGYEQLVAAGRVPGDTKGMAAKDAAPRVRNWHEAAKLLDSGIAAVLKVPEARARMNDEVFRSLFCRRWSGGG